MNSPKSTKQTVSQAHNLISAYSMYPYICFTSGNKQNVIQTSSQQLMQHNATVWSWKCSIFGSHCTFSKEIMKKILSIECNCLTITYKAPLNPVVEKKAQTYLHRLTSHDLYLLFTLLWTWRDNDIFIISFKLATLTFCLTIRVELLIVQLRRCKPMSKRLPTIDVGIQSE